MAEAGLNFRRCMSKYKIDLNIISSGGKDSEDIAKTKEYLEKQYSLKTYSNSNHELGRSIFDVRTDGIQQSRYSMIYVTKDDFRGEPFQNFWRQNALANLIPDIPKPKGCERLLLVLDGVTEDDFTQANPEFKHAVILCTDTNGNWMKKVGETVQKQGVFTRHEEQIEQDAARNRTEWTQETMNAALAMPGGDSQPAEMSQQMDAPSTVQQGREVTTTVQGRGANRTVQAREVTTTVQGRGANRTVQGREVTTTVQCREANTTVQGRGANTTVQGRDSPEGDQPSDVDESMEAQPAVVDSPDCNNPISEAANEEGPNEELDSLYTVSPVHTSESSPWLKRSCSAESGFKLSLDVSLDQPNHSSLQMSSLKHQPYYDTAQASAIAQSVQLFFSGMFLQHQLSQGQQQNTPVPPDASAQQRPVAGGESPDAQQISSTASGSYVEQNSQKPSAQEDSCKDLDACDEQDSQAGLASPAGTEEPEQSEQSWYARLWQNASDAGKFFFDMD